MTMGYHFLTRIEAMRQQEESCYAVRGDYLRRWGNGQEIEVHDGNRESMIEWAYNVTEFLSFQHETVEVGICYLDHYLLSTAGSEALASPKIFQLATMACLYLSIKICEDIVLDSKFMANLSHGLFNHKEIEEMELKVLSALGWRINPPSSMAFVREYLELLPGTIPMELKNKAYTLCEPQIQISVIDYSFINMKASTVAILALLNSLKVLGMETVLLNHVRSLLSHASHTCQDSLSKDIQDRLYDAVIDYSDNTWTTVRTCMVGLTTSPKEYMTQRDSYDGSPCGIFS